MSDKKEVIYIPLEDIIPNRFQPRLAFDDKELNNLANSIIKYGVIQPIIVRNVGEKYEIIAGERRYKASKVAGLKKIPAIVNNTDDNTSAEMALLENLQRKNLTVIEEAKSYKKLIDRGFTQELIASKLSISQSTIANKIRLLNLPKSVQDALLYNKISERHARCLLSINNDELKEELLNKIISNKLTDKQTEDEVSLIVNNKPKEEIKEVPEFKSINTINDLKSLDEITEFNPKNFMVPVGEKNVIDYEEINRLNGLTNETKELIDNINNKDKENMEVENVSLENINTDYLTEDVIKKIEEVRSNIKEDNSFKSKINKIREYLRFFNKNDNTIKTREVDLNNKYQIIIEIDKDAQ